MLTITQLQAVVNNCTKCTSNYKDGANSDPSKCNSMVSDLNINYCCLPLDPDKSYDSIKNSQVAKPGCSVTNNCNFSKIWTPPNFWIF
jgi:hypothetical protein